MSYKIKLDIFEGPFDLLVYLIEQAEMSIYDIQVSEITKQFIDYIERMQAADLLVGGEFMVLAAALIEIKSKMLLPQLRKEGVEGTIEDPRTELVERILEYKRAKAAAEFFAEQQEREQQVYEKPKEDLLPYTKEPDEYLSLELKDFVKAFHLFLQKKKKLEEIRKNYERIERQRMSIESAISLITGLFRRRNQSKLRFSELLRPGVNRYEIILTFMSMLEMIRQRSLTAKQQFNFGEITLTLQEQNDGTSLQSQEGGMIS